MKEQTLRIPVTLPGLNEILRAKGAIGARGRNGARYDSYKALKEQWGGNIVLFCLKQRIQPVSAARFRFRWIEATHRRDPDNIAGGGRKLILDGLVAAGVLPGDGWKYVRGWEDEFIVDPSRQGVEIAIIEQP